MDILILLFLAFLIGRKADKFQQPALLWSFRFLGFYISCIFLIVLGIAVFGGVEYLKKIQQLSTAHYLSKPMLILAFGNIFIIGVVYNFTQYLLRKRIDQNNQKKKDEEPPKDLSYFR